MRLPTHRSTPSWDGALPPPGGHSVCECFANGTGLSGFVCLFVSCGSHCCPEKWRAFPPGQVLSDLNWRFGKLPLLPICLLISGFFCFHGNCGRGVCPNMFSGDWKCRWELDFQTYIHGWGLLSVIVLSLQAFHHHEYRLVWNWVEFYFVSFQVLAVEFFLLCLSLLPFSAHNAVWTRILG